MRSGSDRESLPAPAVSGWRVGTVPGTDFGPERGRRRPVSGGARLEGLAEPSVVGLGRVLAVLAALVGVPLLILLVDLLTR